MMKSKYGILALLVSGTLFVCAGLFATTKKNQIIAYNNYQQSKKDTLTTDICKYNGTGELFMHGTDDDKSSRVQIYHENGRRIASMVSPSFRFYDGFFSPQSSDYLCLGRNARLKMSTATWLTMVENNPVVTAFLSRDNEISSSGFGPNGASMLLARSDDTCLYNKETEEEFEWDRTSDQAIFLNEKYGLEVFRNHSVVNVFSIEKEPKNHILDQDDRYRAQEAILSPDGKMFAVASRPVDEEWEAQVIVYDTETLEEIRTFFIRGRIGSGLRYGQHNSVQFSPDGKYLFVHTWTKDGKALTWYIEIRAVRNFIRIDHPEGSVDGLYELVGDTKMFGGIQKEKAVRLFDLRKPDESVVLPLEGAKMVAVNPDNGSKIKAIIANYNNSSLYRYTGGSFLIKEDEKYDEE